MYSYYDGRKPYEVSEYYTAKIDEICLGIYVSSNGYSITKVGIEEEYDRITQKTYRRYWILDIRGNLIDISWVNISNYVIETYNKYNLRCINTNFEPLLNILSRPITPQIIDVKPENIIALIRGLLTDKKLEVTENLKNDVNAKLSNYNIDDENLFIKSLYLSLCFNLNSVVFSNRFPPLPRGRKDLDFENMPIDELGDYFRNNRHDKVAYDIYTRRWQERQNIELEGLKKNHE